MFLAKSKRSMKNLPTYKTNDSSSYNSQTVTLISTSKKRDKRRAFSYKHVAFGFEEDEGVVVVALLDGTNEVLYWDFRSMLDEDQNSN